MDLSAFNELRLAMAASEVNSSVDYCWDMEARTQNQAVIQLTTGGACFIEAGGRRELVAVGQAFVTEAPGSVTYGFPAEAREPYALAYLNILGDQAAELAREFRMKFGPVINLSRRPESWSLFWEIQERFQEKRFRDSYEESVLLYQLFAALFREASLEVGRGDPIAACYQRVQQRYREPFNINEMAMEVGISREHLARSFRARYGQSPSTMLSQLRLREARILIQTGVLDLHSVAAATGFVDVRALKRLL